MFKLLVCVRAIQYVVFESEQAGKKHRKAEHGNTTVDHQISFMSILTEWVETAALFMCGQQISLSVQSRRHFDWLCED